MTTTNSGTPGRRPIPPGYLILGSLAVLAVPAMLLIRGQQPALAAVTAPPAQADAALSREVSALQLYPDFAEIRAPIQVQEQNFTLHGENEPNILTDTVNLEGIGTLSRTLTGGEGWLAGLEGQPVTVYVNGNPKPATLIRARDLLIRDWNGKYRRVNAEQLAFNAPPPTTGQRSSQTLSFQTDRSGPATLNYLTRGLGWAPHYNLNLSGDQAVLDALADLRNPGDQTYTVKSTELISGDVNVYAYSAQSMNLEADRAYPAATTAPVAGKVGTAQIRPIGELRGLHRFKLDQPFTLKARSTVSLPFMTPKVTSERLNTISTYFSGYDMQNEGHANRSYRLKTDAFLPAGAVLIRDEGHVMGQTQWPDTPAGKPITLNVGDDPELTYTRNVQVVQRDKTGARYKVTFVLKNAKDTPARVRVNENLEGLAGRVLTLQGDAVRDGNTATLAAILPAQGSLTRSFTLDARVRTRQ